MWRQGLLIVAVLVSSAVWAKPVNPTKAKVTPAAPSFRGKLLTFRQLVRVPRPKRQAYLKGVAELVALIEQQQKNYRVASLEPDGSVSKSIQKLMAGSSIWPLAFADTKSIQVPVWNATRKVWECPAQGISFSYQVGTCVTLRKQGKYQTSLYKKGSCPVNTVPVVSDKVGYSQCVPHESIELMPIKRQQDLMIGLGRLSASDYAGKSKDETKVWVDPELRGEAKWGGSSQGQAAAKLDMQEGDETFTEGQSDIEGGSVQTAEVTAANRCEPAALKCAEMTQEERDKGIAKFRSITGSHSTCVSGGFFSRYQPGRERKVGGCEILKDFPSSEQPMISCQSGTALCNPVLFCQGQLVDSDKAGGGTTKTFQPFAICVERGENITRDCLAEYDKNIKAGKVEFTEPGKSNSVVVEELKACDSFTDTFKNHSELTEEDQKLSLPVKEAWEDIASNIEQHYLKYCVNDPDFLTMFCSECDIIGRRIAELNKSADPKACTEPVEEDGKPAGEQTKSAS